MPILHRASFERAYSTPGILSDVSFRSLGRSFTHRAFDGPLIRKFSAERVRYRSKIFKRS